MTQLTIIANIVANEDKVEVVKAELLKLIDITRSEEGCVASFTLNEMTKIG